MVEKFKLPIYRAEETTKTTEPFLEEELEAHLRKAEQEVINAQNALDDLIMSGTANFIKVAAARERRRVAINVRDCREAAFLALIEEQSLNIEVIRLATDQKVEASDEEATVG